MTAVSHMTGRSQGEVHAQAFAVLIAVVSIVLLGGAATSAGAEPGVGTTTVLATEKCC